MQIDVASASPESVSRLMTSLVIPRPIGWVSTVDAQGIRNLAPFSSFNHLPGEPPMVMLSFSQRQGEPKDTLRNILATREFVVNFVPEKLAQAMNCTSGNYPPDVDEFQVANLTPVSSIQIKPPRVGESPASAECVLVEAVTPGRTKTVVVFGEVVMLHVADELLNAKGGVDPKRFLPIARLGGKGIYTKLGELFEMQRPP